MDANFRAAIAHYGESAPGYGRWLLPNGKWIMQDGIDHRNVGNFCKNDWHDFLREGACSIAYDEKANYLWIRTDGLGTAQRQAFEEWIEQDKVIINELKVDFYEFDGLKYEMDVIEIDDADMARLYLTESIAYRIEMGNRDSYKRQYEEEIENDEMDWTTTEEEL